jgi:N-acyl-D-amino-acid deacylase
MTAGAGCGSVRGMNTERMDWILRGGRVADGLGGEPVRADVGIVGDRIAGVGDLAGVPAANEVDAAGNAGVSGVHRCPHAFGRLSADRAGGAVEDPAGGDDGDHGQLRGQRGAEVAGLYHAVGLAGAGAIPATGGRWRSTASLLAAQQPAVNSAMLIGHRAIRAAVMGIAPRAATADEIAKMCGLLEQALGGRRRGVEHGAGLCAGDACAAGGNPGAGAGGGAAGGIYATHMRSEGGRLLEAIDEALDVARATGVRLQISHLKTAGRANWQSSMPRWRKSARRGRRASRWRRTGIPTRRRARTWT